MPRQAVCRLPAHDPVQGIIKGESRTDHLKTVRVRKVLLPPEHDRVGFNRPAVEHGHGASDVAKRFGQRLDLRAGDAIGREKVGSAPGRRREDRKAGLLYARIFQDLAVCQSRIARRERSKVADDAPVSLRAIEPAYGLIGPRLRSARIAGGKSISEDSTLRTSVLAAIPFDLDDLIDEALRQSLEADGKRKELWRGKRTGENVQAR